MTLTRRYVTIIGLAAVMAVSFSACGGDDDDSASGEGGSAATGEADAPAAAGAFNDLRQALEAQGLVVKELPKASLDGAEDGVDVSGDKSGSARLFSTEADAKAYAEKADGKGQKTVVVGTVVCESSSQADAQFIADAYEGG